jgi:hypothetical protein
MTGRPPSLVGWIRRPAHTRPTPDLIPCPDPTCKASAKIVDRVDLPSTSGPVPHVETSCPNGHGFLMPCDRW